MTRADDTHTEGDEHGGGRLGRTRALRDRPPPARLVTRPGPDEQLVLLPPPRSPVPPSRRRNADPGRVTTPGRDHRSAQAVPRPEEQPTMQLWPQVGELLGLGRASTYEAARRGDIPTMRFGRRIAVPTAALRRLLGIDTPEP
jgi:hypothetical protein